MLPLITTPELNLTGVRSYTVLPGAAVPAT